MRKSSQYTFSRVKDRFHNPKRDVDHAGPAAYTPKAGMHEHLISHHNKPL